MFYSGIKPYCIENGPGVRVSLFVSGCRNHCKGCFQPETWDFCHGQEFTEDTENTILKMLNPPYIDGLTLLGGDPFEPENQEALLPFVQKVREMYPDKTIWAYTGYVLEKDLSYGGRNYTKNTDKLLSMIDVLVDGPFVEEKKNISIAFRGSENQRVIDLKETLKTGTIFLKDVDRRR